jgi:transglutaminase-like putative cysteine protease
MIASANILLITAVLFFLLPRTAREIAGFLPPGGVRLSGFGDHVGLGAIGRIQRDQRAVMHVKAYTSTLPAGLKWRGDVLTDFDGRTWSEGGAERVPVRMERGAVAVADGWQRRRIGTRSLYRVEVEGTGSPTLFVAGTPEFLNVGSARLLQSAASTFRMLGSDGRGLHYEVSAFLNPAPGSIPEPRTFALTAAERERFLRLPRVDTRIRELAVQDTAGADNDAMRAHLLEHHLRRDYGYTLELPKVEPRDPLVNFLFERREGHCEYFASAMAVMLRTLGIPARLVDGFQSGQYNPYSGQIVVRASDAHAWVEAFLDGQGWLTFDPTPYGKPQEENSLIAKLRLWADAANTFWGEWVLSYDLTRQMRVAGDLNSSAAHWSERAMANVKGWATSPWRRPAPWLWVVLLFAVAGGAIAFRRRQTFTPGRRNTLNNESARLYARMLRLMEKRGLPKAASSTADEFAAAASTSPWGAQVRDFTDEYQRLRFGAADRDLQRLRQILGQLQVR